MTLFRIISVLQKPTRNTVFLRCMNAGNERNIHCHHLSSFSHFVARIFTDNRCLYALFKSHHTVKNYKLLKTGRIYNKCFALHIVHSYQRYCSALLRPLQTRKFSMISFHVASFVCSSVRATLSFFP